MVNESKALFDEKLEKLISNYLQALPDKISIIKEAWQPLDLDNLNEQAFKGVHRLIHNLAGGAGMYGLLSISKQARSILVLMKPLLDGKDVPVSDIGFQISQEIKILEQVTKQALVEVQHQTQRFGACLHP